MRASSWRQSPAKSSITRTMRGERMSVRARQFDSQETQSLPYRNAALQQKGADLINDARPLTDQTFAHAVQRLQVELADSLGRDELHGWALHGLGDRLCVAEVVLLSL